MSTRTTTIEMVMRIIFKVILGVVAFVAIGWTIGAILLGMPPE